MKNPFKTFKEYTDSGFGNAIENQPERLVNQDGSLNVKRTGLSFLDHFSIFHELIRMKWRWFNIIVILSYLMINLFFGTVYFLIGPEALGITKASNLFNEFLDAFYFSAQTFSTVGYGRISPVSPLANIVAVIEMLIGMMYLALATGLLYGRFSRPVSKIVYSRNALIAPYRDGTGLMFRMSNAKNNLLIEVEVQMLLTMKLIENDKEVRRFYQLELERKKINMMALSWTVVHPIDSNSPLADMKEQDLRKADIEIMIMVNAQNDTISQSIHSRTSYKKDDIIWGAKFSPIFEGKNKKTYVSIDKIGDYAEVKL